MPQAKPSLIGQTFFKLKVISDAPRRHRQAFSVCLCECGVQTIVNNSHLKFGRTKGCLNCRPKKHGLSHSGTYTSWAGMKSRTGNPKDLNYKNYGGRGITVCQRWLDSFANFLADMGERPEGTSLERNDNNKGYYKENCCWATKIEQANNARNNRRATVRGISGTLANLIRHFGVSSDLVRARIKLGWPLEKAFFAPLHRGGYPPKESSHTNSSGL